MILKFNPVFKEKIWGGKKLHDFFGFQVDGNIGECWGISAHQNGLCTVKDGVYKGKTLADIWENHKELFGNHPSVEFPILVKLIDALDDLSIQVHPDDEAAKKMNLKGKNECWYILDANDSSEIVIGHTAQNMDDFLTYIQQDNYEHLVKRIPIQKGDYFYIEAGTLHAICKGTLLLEVQQSSDLTYRFYDYKRKENGVERELNLSDALATVKIPNSEVVTTHDTTNFGFRVFDTLNKTTVSNSKHGVFFVILEGKGILNNQAVQKGDFIFITPDESITFSNKLKIAEIII